MFKLSRITTAALAALLALPIAFAPRPAAAYQVDCAILLCLSGGWPASAPCAHARSVFIRRITPWPIEPPLQIWRCPMRTVLNEAHPSDPHERFLRYAFEDAPLQSYPVAPDTLTRAASNPFASSPDERDQTTAQNAIVTLAQSISEDNGTADIDISGPAFDFVRTIRVWRVDHYRHREQGRDDDCNETDRTYLGTYGVQGNFGWVRSRARDVPAWMNLSTRCNGMSGLYRAVGIEWHDYEGRHGYELVRY